MNPYGDYDDHEDYVSRIPDDVRSMRLLGNDYQDTETIIQERIQDLVDDGIPRYEAELIIRDGYHENVEKRKYEKELEDRELETIMHQSIKNEEDRIIRRQEEEEEYSKMIKERKETVFKGLLEYLARIRETKFKDKISEFKKNNDTILVLSSNETNDLEKIIDEYLKRKKISENEKSDEKEKIIDFIVHENNELGGSNKTRKRRTHFRKVSKNKRRQTRKRKVNRKGKRNGKKI
jgi:hypothetical protein